MNGRAAKKLRRIARSLGLDPETRYTPGGPLRRRAGYRDEAGVWQEGAPMPRPAILTSCERRAYREAKKIYLNKPISMLMPEEVKEKAYQAQVVDSMRQYASQD
jgi:hypothetical protein